MGELAKAIASVVLACGWVAKDKRHQKGFEYASAEGVIDHLRGQIAIAELAIVPSVVSVESVETGSVSKSGAKANRVRVTMEFVLLHSSGESCKSTWIGDAESYDCTSVYAACTGCHREFLIKTFLVPRGDDPEEDDGQKTQQQASQIETSRTNRASSEPTKADLGRKADEYVELLSAIGVENAKQALLARYIELVGSPKVISLHDLEMAYKDLLPEEPEQR